MFSSIIHPYIKFVWRNEYKENDLFPLNLSWGFINTQNQKYPNHHQQKTIFCFNWIYICMTEKC